MQRIGRVGEKRKRGLAARRKKVSGGGSGARRPGHFHRCRRHIAGCACDWEIATFTIKTLNLTAVLEKEGTGYVSL
jgi:hypothetical protein